MAEHVVDRGHIILAVRPVAEVVGGHLPSFPGVFDPRREALVLFLLGDVEEYLHDGSAVVGLLRFEFVDFVIAAAPLRLGDQTLDPFNQHAAVPASVEDGDFLRCGELVPEAP